MKACGIYLRRIYLTADVNSRISPSVPDRHGTDACVLSYLQYVARLRDNVRMISSICPDKQRADDTNSAVRECTTEAKSWRNVPKRKYLYRLK